MASLSQVLEAVFLYCRKKEEFMSLIGHGTETLGRQCRGLEPCVLISCRLELLCESLLVGVN